MVDAEMALARGADGIVTVSEAEATHFRQAGHTHVHVLGHAIRPCPTTNGFGARRGFLFVGAIGADDTPNTDSLLWFVRECWPGISQALGDQARLDIVGPCDSDSVRALASPAIRVHGRVDDLTPFFERAYSTKVSRSFGPRGDWKKRNTSESMSFSGSSRSGRGAILS